jgi:hypothetical protein
MRSGKLTGHHSLVSLNGIGDKPAMMLPVCFVFLILEWLWSEVFFPSFTALMMPLNWSLTMPCHLLTFIISLTVGVAV